MPAPELFAKLNSQNFPGLTPPNLIGASAIDKTNHTARIVVGVRMLIHEKDFSSWEYILDGNQRIREDEKGYQIAHNNPAEVFQESPKFSLGQLVVDDEGFLFVVTGIRWLSNVHLHNFIPESQKRYVTEAGWQYLLGYWTFDTKYEGEFCWWSQKELQAYEEGMLLYEEAC
jgi:hypothetical protein